MKTREKPRYEYPYTWPNYRNYVFNTLYNTYRVQSETDGRENLTLVGFIATMITQILKEFVKNDNRENFGSRPAIIGNGVNRAIISAIPTFFSNVYKRLSGKEASQYDGYSVAFNEEQKKPFISIINPLHFLNPFRYVRAALNVATFVAVISIDTIFNINRENSDSNIVAKGLKYIVGAPLFLAKLLIQPLASPEEWPPIADFIRKIAEKKMTEEIKMQNKKNDEIYDKDVNGMKKKISIYEKKIYFISFTEENEKNIEDIKKYIKKVNDLIKEYHNLLPPSDENRKRRGDLVSLLCAHNEKIKEIFKEIEPIKQSSDKKVKSLKPSKGNSFLNTVTRLFNGDRLKAKAAIEEQISKKSISQNDKVSSSSIIHTTPNNTIPTNNHNNRSVQNKAVKLK